MNKISLRQNFYRALACASVQSDIFLPRDDLRKCGTSCRPVSVRLSSVSSVTVMYCSQTAKDIVRLLSRPGSSII